MNHDFILLDRSGSMEEQGRWPEALVSINSYVAKLAVDNVDTAVTLVAFDQVGGDMAFETIRDNVRPSDWSGVTNQDAKPRGGTPLNDAIARICQQALAGREGAQFDKVAIIVMTDGFENSSRRDTFQSATALLNECRDKGWQTIFLGAQFADVITQGQQYSNSRGGTFAMGRNSSRDTMNFVASSRASYGLTGESMMEASEEVLAKLAKDKPEPVAP